MRRIERFAALLVWVAFFAETRAILHCPLSRFTATSRPSSLHSGSSGCGLPAALSQFTMCGLMATGCNFHPPACRQHHLLWLDRDRSGQILARNSEYVLRPATTQQPHVMSFDEHLGGAMMFNSGLHTEFAFNLSSWAQSRSKRRRKTSTVVEAPLPESIVSQLCDRNASCRIR